MPTSHQSEVEDMDYQSVAPPSNYGAPQVFQQGQQGGQPAQGQQQPNPVSAMLQKAKQLLSSGQISSDQYTQLAQQYGGSQNAQLATMGGNMGAGMPGATGQPLNIMPGQGG